MKYEGNTADMQERISTTSRREREREQHRNDILDAAEEEFAKKGISNATIEDIAKRAEFSVGSIYNFFSNKDEVIRNVFRRLLNARISGVERNVMPFISDPLKALEQLSYTWVRHYSEHFALIRAGQILRSSLGKLDGDPVADKEIVSLLRELDEKTLSVFKEGVRQGIFHNIDPVLLVVMFYGICNSFSTYWKQIADTNSLELRHKELYKVMHFAITGHPPKEFDEK